MIKAGKKNNMKKGISLFSLFILLLAIQTGCESGLKDNEAYVAALRLFGARDAEQYEEVSLNTNGRTWLNVNNSYGNVVFTRGENDFLKIKAIKKIKGRGGEGELQKLLDGIKLEVEKSESSINITIKPVESREKLIKQWVDLDIEVPGKMMFIEAKTSSGNIAITGIKDVNSIDVSVESGNIEIAEVSAKSCELNLASGDIFADGFYGNGKIKVSSGKVELKRAEGSLEYKATSGKLYIDGFKGKVACDVSSGDVVIRNARLKPDSLLYITSGNMEIDMLEADEGGSYRFLCTLGNIKLHIPRNAGFDIKAKAANGNVKNDFPEDSSGHKPDFNIFVTSGNINIIKK